MGLLDRLGGGAPRVAFLGLDGVPASLVAQHPDVFSNLTAIADAGSTGIIDSVTPPDELACWPALTTGRNPGRTGVYGLQDRETGTYETYVPMGGDVQTDRVWDYVAAADRNATVLNVPVTAPPQQDVQRMVSGFLSPSVDQAAHPPAVAEYLDGIGYRLQTNAKLGHRDDKSDFLANAHETLDARYEAFDHFVDANDWALFCGVFTATDHVNHFLYRDYLTDGEYKQEFLEFYEKLDRYVGALHDSLPDDVALIVASDHGFTGLDYEVSVNAWLQREGWLDYESDDPETLADISDDTRAYSFSPGRFYLNLDGREPRGNVPESEYHTVRDELATAIREFTGPDGTPVVDRVVEKEAAFDGAHDDMAPDLVAIPNDGFDLKAGFRNGRDVFETGHRTGMHTFDDALLVTDEPGLRTDAASLYDLTPTMLDLLDIDYDTSGFDGKTLL
ncbi:alkaline phosphatase family protein [Salarchaeum japonicum]|uniref:alkaline phosphatase family protein n=1 Tax=Salarchaeum japonicum TaxID=555573 RepID=UPI003C771ACC